MRPVRGSGPGRRVDVGRERGRQGSGPGDGQRPRREGLVEATSQLGHVVGAVGRQRRGRGHGPHGADEPDDLVALGQPGGIRLVGEVEGARDRARACCGMP